MDQRLIVFMAAAALAACGPTSPPPIADLTPSDPTPVAEDDEGGGGGGGGGARTPYTSFDIEDNRLVLPGPIVFATGDSTIDESASEAALWYVHDYMAAKSYVTLMRVEGHGDQAGEDAMILTGDRALTVARWLVAHGIDCNRLLAAAFGDSKPVADASTADGRARNRRIEVVNASLRGIAIGGMPLDGGAPAAAPVCD